MPGSNDSSDGRDDAASAGSSEGQREMNPVDGVARAWVRGAGDDRLFEAVVRAVEAELLSSVRAMACGLVGHDDAGDVISGVWAKLWADQRAQAETAGGEDGAKGEEGQRRGFDPDQGSFMAYFRGCVYHACVDVLRARKTVPQPAAAVTAGELLPDKADPLDDVLDRVVLVKLIAAVEVLPFSEKQCGMLCQSLGVGVADPGAAGPASAAQRKAWERLRKEADELAGLTGEERRAASLMRKHHSVAAAADAARDLDVEGLYRSATRKVLTLFWMEGDDRQ